MLAFPRAPFDSYGLPQKTTRFFFIRNHFLSNLILDSLKFKKVLKIKGKNIEIGTWFNVQLYQNNVNMILL